MGVPKFYRWLSERYPLLNQPVKLRGAPQIDNLVSSQRHARRRHRACSPAARNAAARTPESGGLVAPRVRAPGHRSASRAVSAAAPVTCGSRRSEASACDAPPVAEHAAARTVLTCVRVTSSAVPGHERRDP